MKSGDSDSDDDSFAVSTFTCVCNLAFPTQRGLRTHQSHHCKKFQFDTNAKALELRLNAIGLPKFMIHINQAFCFGFGHRRTADVAKILLTTVNGKNDVITNDAEGYEGLDEKIKALFHEKRDELDTQKDQAEETDRKRDKSHGRSKGKGKDKRAKTAAVGEPGSPSQGAAEAQEIMNANMGFFLDPEVVNTTLGEAQILVAAGRNSIHDENPASGVKGPSWVPGQKVAASSSSSSSRSLRGLNSTPSPNSVSGVPDYVNTTVGDAQLLVEASRDTIHDENSTSVIQSSVSTTEDDSDASLSSSSSRSLSAPNSTPSPIPGSAGVGGGTGGGGGGGGGGGVGSAPAMSQGTAVGSSSSSSSQSCSAPSSTFPPTPGYDGGGGGISSASDTSQGTAVGSSSSPSRSLTQGSAASLSSSSSQSSTFPPTPGCGGGGRRGGRGRSPERGTTWTANSTVVVVGCIKLGEAFLPNPNGTWVEELKREFPSKTKPLGFSDSWICLICSCINYGSKSSCTSLSCWAYRVPRTLLRQHTNEGMTHTEARKAVKPHHNGRLRKMPMHFIKLDLATFGQTTPLPCRVCGQAYLFNPENCPCVWKPPSPNSNEDEDED